MPTSKKPRTNTQSQKAKQAKVTDDIKWNKYANQISDEFYLVFQNFLVNGVITELDVEGLTKAFSKAISKILPEENEKTKDVLVKFFSAATARGFESQIGTACCGNFGEFVRLMFENITSTSIGVARASQAQH